MAEKPAYSGIALPEDPASASSATRKSYVDGKAGGGSIPPSEVNDLLAWTTDPVNTTATPSITAGTIYLARIVAPTAITCTGCWFNNAASGSGNTLGYVGLYSMAGDRLAVTGNQTTAWQSTGDKQVPWTAPSALGAGDYYVAFLTNGSTTTPKPRSATSAAINLACSASRLRAATGPTGQTSLPASLTPSSFAGSVSLLGFGLY